VLFQTLTTYNSLFFFDCSCVVMHLLRKTQASQQNKENRKKIKRIFFNKIFIKFSINIIVEILDYRRLPKLFDSVNPFTLDYLNFLL